MTKRETVPPMRPRDTLLTPTQPASAPLPPSYVKTSAYVRPDQIELLDTLRASHRKAGRRTTSASDLIRAALDLAEHHQEEWDDLIAGVG